MRFESKMLFTLFAAAVFCFVVVTAREWPIGTRLFPWYVGIPMLVLSLVQLALELYRSTRPVDLQSGPLETGDLQVDWNIGVIVVIQRAAKFFGWIIGLILGIWLLGFFVTVPLFIFFYLKLEAKEGWLLSLALALAILLFLIGLFDQILHTHWPRPLILWPEAMLKSVLPWVR